MHLTVFQSGKGDCLILENSKRSARILVDGGMPAAYREHVAPSVGKLKKIDVVYVSHIDQDHIGGILKMLDDDVAWRVHKFQTDGGNSKHKKPAVPRPPTPNKIWHNAFHEQLKKNAGAVEEALAAAAPVLNAADLVKMREAGLAVSELVASVREAIQVSRRIGKKQLGIPLNPEAKGKLMMARAGQKPFTVGGMKVTILGPTAKDLELLRKNWNKWLRDNEKALKTIREKAAKDEKSFGTSDVGRLLRAISLPAEAFGNPESVTPPNLASLTLLVEEGGSSILLTGDARGDQILAGLRAVGRLADGATFAVDVLKVPHHGSENNVDQAFCDTVIARDYVFCGNGEHENPDPRVVDLIAKARLKSAPTSFKFWFSSSESVVDKQPASDHMAAIEKLVKRLAKSSKGRLKFQFLKSGSSMAVT
ncbi:MAG TPA: MBL fold metallo-hydrolase [Thermoanaerobaculia bacterium]|nr:MBL fold metallo-hydrolase [Thermoanaerobaculia bacterium]